MQRPEAFVLISSAMYIAEYKYEGKVVPTTFLNELLSNTTSLNSTITSSFETYTESPAYADDANMTHIVQRVNTHVVNDCRVFIS